MRKVYLAIALLTMGCKHEVKPIEEQVADTLNVDVVMADTIAEETKIRQMTIYEDNNHRIYLEKAGGEVYCYADSQKVVFHDDYMDLGAMAMFFHRPANSRYVYIVGDIVPNGDGWTVRFHLYRMDKHTFAVKHIGNFAGIRFEDNGFKAATARLLNPDAACTADYRYAIRNYFFDNSGRLIRKGRESGDEEFNKIYGDGLIDPVGLGFGD